MGTIYKHLSCEECTLNQLSPEQGCTLRVIARSLQGAEFDQSSAEMQPLDQPDNRFPEARPIPELEFDQTLGL